MSDYRKTSFTLDALENKAFSGYTSGETWNGFACPLFSYDEATKILDLLQERTGDETLESWEYEASKDKFLLHSSTHEEPETFEGQPIEVEGEVVDLYPIGSYSWTWLEA